MNIYTDFNILDVETITSIKETINNDFNLLGEDYNKVEKYIDSDNTFNFDISFLLNKTEKYNLYNQVSESYFWINIFKDKFKILNSISGEYTVKIEKNEDLVLSDNSELFLTFKYSGSNGIFKGKVIEIDNTDPLFTILTFDEEIVYSINSNTYLSIIKLCYLNQTGITFNMINEDLYKTDIKTITTTGALDTTDLFPSPISEIIDIEIVGTQKTYGERFLDGWDFQPTSSKPPIQHMVKRRYFYIHSQTVEKDNKIYTFSVNKHIKGTNLNINIRMLTFDKETQEIESNDIFFNHYISENNAYNNFIDTFIVSENEEDFIILIKVKNTVLINQLVKGEDESSYISKRSYLFETYIDDNFIRPTQVDYYDNKWIKYPNFEGIQSENSVIRVENNNFVLYRFELNKIKKFTFFSSNIDKKNIYNAVSETQPLIISNTLTNLESLEYKYYKEETIMDNIGYNEYYFFISNTFYDGNEPAVTYEEFQDSNQQMISRMFIYNNNIYLMFLYTDETGINKNFKIINISTKSVIFQERILSNNIGGIIFKDQSYDIFKSFIKDGNLYVNLNKNDDKIYQLTLKIDNFESGSNIFSLIQGVGLLNSSIASTTGSMTYLSDSLNNIYIYNCNYRIEYSLSLPDVSNLINLSRNNIDGSNIKYIQIDTNIDNVITLEEDVKPDIFIGSPPNDVPARQVKITTNNVLKHSVVNLNNDNVMYIIPLFKNTKGYNYLYVILDSNFAIIEKFYL